MVHEVAESGMTEQLSLTFVSKNLYKLCLDF